MDYDRNDMTVLGCIKGGAKTFGSIKTRSGLKSEQLEQILSILDKSELIQTDEAKGLLGQPKPIMTITDKGTKQVEEYISQLNKKWKELVALAIAGEREKLDEIIKESPFLVNMMLFYQVIDLHTLARLNLRFLLEGKRLCYKCKCELGRFSQKFSVKDVRKFNFKMPRGMTTRDDLCGGCFDKLTGTYDSRY